MARVGDYSTWWPWLRSFEADGLQAGDRWSCLVQPPLPYRVRFVVTIDEVEPGTLVRATVTGDVEGRARLELSSLGPHLTQARLLADLRPANPLLRVLAVVAAPVVRRAHDWVLDTGVRQFRQRGLDPPVAT